MVNRVAAAIGVIVRTWFHAVQPAENADQRRPASATFGSSVARASLCGTWYTAVTTMATR